MEKVTLAFDPRCPWCYQTSRWLRHLEDLKVVELDYRLYCLEVAHLEPGADPVPLGDTARSAMSLRVCVAISRIDGSRAMGRFYKALGDLVWETDEPAQDREAMVRKVVATLGYPDTLVDEAMADPSTWEEVLRQHRELAKDYRGLGVPSLILDAAPDEAIFGPVICRLPKDEEARTLWDKTRTFAASDTVFELKLTERSHYPDLPGWHVKRSQLTFGTHPWLPPEPDEPDEPEEAAPEACSLSAQVQKG